jgi:hypothetical protein
LVGESHETILRLEGWKAPPSLSPERAFEVASMGFLEGHDVEVLPEEGELKKPPSEVGE